jgi:hypothetical protein
MEVASTKQFRKVVRKYLAKKGITVLTSFTNGSARKDSNPRRTVGFWAPRATVKVAAKIEKKLNKKGLTADTRLTTSEAGHNYIRGTCDL